MAFDPTSKHVGMHEPDCASLTYGGVDYECVVWRNLERGTSGAGYIEAAVFTRLESGQRSLIDTFTVRNDNSGARQLDCPRVVSANQHFVVFWIEHDRDEGSVTTAAVHRSVMDLSDIDNGFVYDASTAISNYCLYDVCVDEGNTHEDIYLVYSRTAGTDFGVAQYTSPYRTTDTTFTAVVAAAHQARVLGCSAHYADGNFVFHWQNASAISTHRMDVNTGANGATGGNFTSPVSDYSRVASCRVVADEIVLVAEGIPTSVNTGANNPARRMRFIMRGRVDATTGANVSGITPQITYNLNMLSRPWVYRDGYISVTSNQVYMGVGYCGLDTGVEWSNNFAYIANLDYHSLTDPIITDADSVPMIPVCALTDASVDCRPGNYSPEQSAIIGENETHTLAAPLGEVFGKRANHVSHVMLQPQGSTLSADLKSRTFAYISVERLMSTDTLGTSLNNLSVVPVQSGVRLFTFHNEDPWMSRRDSTEGVNTDAVFTVAPWTNGQSVEIGGRLVYNGGLMQSYDGNKLVEHGFLWPPEVATVTNGTAGALTADSTYYYAFNWAWIDDGGSLHRSAFSSVIPVSISGAEDQVTFDVRTMTMSMRDNQLHHAMSRPIVLEVWRTTVTGGAIDTDSTTGNYTLRRVWGSYLSGSTGVYVNAPQNDRTAWSISVADGFSDGNVTNHELCPFQLDTSTLAWNVPPPINTVGATVIESWKNRVWVKPPNEPVIMYSNEVLPLGTQAVSPEFSDFNRFRIDDLGEVTGLKAMDNQLIVFTSDAIYSLTGEGNDATGTGSTLSIQVVSNNTGCMEPRSIVLGPPGIFFQSRKGYYLLSRSLSLDFTSAGFAVEDFIRQGGNVMAATLLEDRHQVRLTINGQPSLVNDLPIVLVYDYLIRQWSSIPMHDHAASSVARRTQSACAWAGRENDMCHVVLQEGAVCVERASTSAVYSDEGIGSTVSVPIDIQTEWIHVSGIAGFKRVREIVVQIEHPDASEVSADLYYDLDGSYDDSSPDDTFTWSSGTLGHLRIRPSVQKMAAFMLRVYESGTVPATENIRVVSVTLDVAVRRGPRRVPDTQIGT